MAKVSRLSLPAAFHDVLLFKRFCSLYIAKTQEAPRIAQILELKTSQVKNLIEVVRIVLFRQDSPRIKATPPERLKTIRLYANYLNHLCQAKNMSLQARSLVMTEAESESHYKSLNAEFQRKLNYPLKSR